MNTTAIFYSLIFDEKKLICGVLFFQQLLAALTDSKPETQVLSIIPYYMSVTNYKQNDFTLEDIFDEHDFRSLLLNFRVMA